MKMFKQKYNQPIVKSRSSILLGGFLVLLCPLIATAGSWDLKLELENIYDEDGNRDTRIEPTIRYKADRWNTSFEYEKAVHPESKDGRIEWQFDYNWEFEKIEFTLRNELQYDLDKNSTKAELTPRFYYHHSKQFLYGFDLEIDYYDSTATSEFGLFEVEIEPTVAWRKKSGKNRYILELEAPVMRLYSDDDAEDNFEYVGYEVVLSYRRKLGESSAFDFVFKIPYDEIKEEFEYKPNFAWRYKF